MNAMLISFAAGIVTSIAAEALWEWFQKNGARALKRKLTRIHRRKPAPAGFLTIGNSQVPWMVCAYGPYTRSTIKILYNAHETKKPPEIQTLHEELVKDVKKREAKGDPVPFNGLGYRLEKFFTGSRTGPAEDPELTLSFRPTDYFTMLVTDARLDEPIIVSNARTTLRKRYADRVDIAYSPVPEFATHFGLGIMVVTLDSQIIFSERGLTAVDAHVFFPSVAEGSSRPADAGPSGGPDPYRTATRGIAEELGIEVDSDQIRFLSFGANAVLCEYALCGVTYIDHTAEELSKIRSLGIPKDRWESQKLHFVKFQPETVAEFMKSHKPWSPFAIVCAIHALYDAYGQSRLEKAFRNTNIVLSQHLPKE